MTAAAHAAEIARTFDLGNDPGFTGRVERGEQGQVEELVTSRGAFAVKTSFGDPDLDGEDAAFQAAAWATGVPTPEVVPAAGGAWHAEIGGLPVRVYQWIDLLPPDAGYDPAETGRVVAAVHRTPFRGTRPQHMWYTEPVGAERWDALIEELEEAGAPFADGLGALRDELVALEALLRPATDLRTCHRDLWTDNMRPGAAGGLWVIDWENCGLASPGEEIAGVVFEFGYGDPARAREVYAAYREAGGPGTMRTRGDFSMTIAQLGHITEIACRIWLNRDTSEEERRRQEGRIGQGIEQPLTVAVIDELLDAVASVT